VLCSKPQEQQSDDHSPVLLKQIAEQDAITPSSHLVAESSQSDDADNLPIRPSLFAVLL